MKATFIFSLPEEQEEYEITRQASSMHCALWKLSQDIRSKLKYAELSEEEHKLWEEFRTMFYDALNEYDVDIG